MYHDDADGASDYPEMPLPRDVAAVEEEHAPRRSPSRAGRMSLALAVIGASLLAIGLDLSYYFLIRGAPGASAGPVFAGCLLAASGLVLTTALVLGGRALFVLRDRGPCPWTGSVISFMAVSALAILAFLAIVR